MCIRCCCGGQAWRAMQGPRRVTRHVSPPPTAMMKPLPGLKAFQLSFKACPQALFQGLGPRQGNTWCQRAHSGVPFFYVGTRKSWPLRAEVLCALTVPHRIGKALYRSPRASPCNNFDSGKQLFPPPPPFPCGTSAQLLYLMNNFAAFARYQSPSPA